jgi:GntR family transcriptional regulator of arabinose operon
MSRLEVDKSNPMPRYLQVKSILEGWIREGKFKPGARMPGERDIAQDLQVSQMTANKAILALVDEGWLYREHGRGTYVCQDFRPPAPAVLRVGIVAPLSEHDAMSDVYLSSLFAGMQRAIINAPVSLSLLEVYPETMYDRLMTAELNGFLLANIREQSIPTAQRLYEEGKRLVALGSAWERLAIPFVDSDNRSGAQMAVRHLLGLGHRRIVGVFSLISACNTQHRLLAFRETLEQQGLCPAEDDIILGDNVFPISAEAKQLVCRRLRQRPAPTAFFCGGYHLALEVMRIIRDEGLSIPDDVSVVGFDDPVSASHLTPPLTTVRQPLEEMGGMAMSMILHWLSTHEEPRRQNILPTELIVRGSTAPVGE